MLKLAPSIFLYVLAQPHASPAPDGARFGVLAVCAYRGDAETLAKALSAAAPQSAFVLACISREPAASSRTLFDVWCAGAVTDTFNESGWNLKRDGKEESPALAKLARDVLASLPRELQPYKGAPGPARLPEPYSFTRDGAGGAILTREADGASLYFQPGDDVAEAEQRLLHPDGSVISAAASQYDFDPPRAAYACEVAWDCDTDRGHGPPARVQVEVEAGMQGEALEDALSEALSNRYGFTHNGFSYSPA